MTRHVYHAAVIYETCHGVHGDAWPAPLWEGGDPSSSVLSSQQCYGPYHISSDKAACWIRKTWMGEQQRGKKKNGRMIVEDDYTRSKDASTTSDPAGRYECGNFLRRDILGKYEETIFCLAITDGDSAIGKGKSQ